MNDAKVQLQVNFLFAISCFTVSYRLFSNMQNIVLQQQTNSQRRYSKVISHDLAEALKAQQRRRQQARKKEIQESASLRGVMEEKIVRKITAVSPGICPVRRCRYEHKSSLVDKFETRH